MRDFFQLCKHPPLTFSMNLFLILFQTSQWSADCTKIIKLKNINKEPATRLSDGLQQCPAYCRTPPFPSADGGNIGSLYTASVQKDKPLSGSKICATHRYVCSTSFSVFKLWRFTGVKWVALHGRTITISFDGINVHMNHCTTKADIDYDFPV